MSDEGELHVVRQGESTTSLAYEHGLFWQTVWKHPKNAQLKSKRKDQNVLMPGDEIFIPAKRLKEEQGATGQRHRFKRKGVPETLNVRFLDLEGQPYKNEPYVLDVDGKLLKGNLDGDGWLRVKLPPSARSAHVEIGDAGELAMLDVDLGHLDPIDELAGVQGRLKNLGLYSGAVGGERDDELDAAVYRFKETQGMEPGIEIDDAFRSKLKEVHGV